MNRHPNKPYRQKWHMPRIRTKPRGVGVDSLDDFMWEAVEQVLSPTNRMRRKRAHHIRVEKPVKLWSRVNQSVACPASMEGSNSI